MKKLLFVVLVLALIAVPMSAFAQNRVIPQVIPVVFNGALAVPGAPAGFPPFTGPLNGCLTGGGSITTTNPVTGGGNVPAGANASLPFGVSATSPFVPGAASTTAEAVQWVGNVLCIDPNFLTTLVGCPATITLSNGVVLTLAAPGVAVPIIQRVQLTKFMPRVGKCPDVFPGASFSRAVTTWPTTITPFTALPIRLWFPIKFDPPGTRFTLTVRVACPYTRPDLPGRIIQVIRTATVSYTVAVTPQLLPGVIMAMAAEPLGTAEIPCITDQSLVNALLVLAYQAANAPNVDALSVALNSLEDALFNRAIPLTTIALDAATQTIFSPPFGALFGLSGAGPLAPGGGIAAATFLGSASQPAIIDTFENPCYCKLIADLEAIRTSVGLAPGAGAAPNRKHI